MIDSMYTPTGSLYTAVDMSTHTHTMCGFQPHKPQTPHEAEKLAETSQIHHDDVKKDAFGHLQAWSSDGEMAMNAEENMHFTGEQLVK